MFGADADPHAIYIHLKRQRGRRGGGGGGGRGGGRGPGSSQKCSLIYTLTEAQSSDDKDLVLAAVRLDPLSLGYADKALLADKEFVLAAMRVEPFMLLWAAAGLLQSDDFMAQAVPILRAKYESWFEDGVLAAMRLEHFVFQRAAAELLQSDDFVQQAVLPMLLLYSMGFASAVRRFQFSGHTPSPRRVRWLDHVWDWRNTGEDSGPFWPEHIGRRVSWLFRASFRTSWRRRTCCPSGLQFRSAATVVLRRCAGVVSTLWSLHKPVDS